MSADSACAITHCILHCRSKNVSPERGRACGAACEPERRHRRESPCQRSWSILSHPNLVPHNGALNATYTRLHHFAALDTAAALCCRTRQLALAGSGAASQLSLAVEL